MKRDEYIALIKTMKRTSNTFEQLCKYFKDCEGCPFKKGVNRGVIARAWGIGRYDVKCANCQCYDQGKKRCSGWKADISDENHYCVFYTKPLPSEVTNNDKG